MSLSDLLAPGGVVVDAPAASRKQALHLLADLAEKTLNAPARDVFDGAIAREKLGSTGLGGGVAIPHARLDSLEGARGVFARLRQGVDFDAVDGAPVDLVFLLIAPSEPSAEHLKALARISRLLRKEAVREALRAAPDAAAVTAILAGDVKPDAA